MHEHPANVDGLVVVHVKEADQPLYDAGRPGRGIITEVNGQAVTSTDEFESIVKGPKAGSYLKLYVMPFARATAGRSSPW